MSLLDLFLVDSHCHLDLLNEEGGSEVYKVNQTIIRARAQGVGHLLNVCVSLAGFHKVLRTAQQFPFVSASVGLHPNSQTEAADIATLVKLGQDPKVVAVGETGLDYFRSTGDLGWQRERFRTHIRAAKQLKKPLIIHTRAAKEDTMQILAEESAQEVGGVMHCFTEDWHTALRALELNFYISFSGIVTFKNAAAIQEVAKRVPLESLLIETDSPYLAPNPHRGKLN
jgi:TatD DNase family protein